MCRQIAWSSARASTPRSSTATAVTKAFASLGDEGRPNASATNRSTQVSAYTPSRPSNISK